MRFLALFRSNNDPADNGSSRVRTALVDSRGVQWTRAFAANGTGASGAPMLAETTTKDNSIVTAPGNWAERNLGAVASATHNAGGTGNLQVITSISAALSCASITTTEVSVRLINGPSGSGAIVWERLIAPVGAAIGIYSVDLSGLTIALTDDDVTLEFSGSAGVGTSQSVAFTGFGAVFS